MYYRKAISIPYQQAAATYPISNLDPPHHAVGMALEKSRRRSQLERDRVRGVGARGLTKEERKKREPK